MGSRGAPTQNRMSIGRNILDLDAGHSAIMAPLAPHRTMLPLQPANPTTGGGTPKPAPRDNNLITKEVL